VPSWNLLPLSTFKRSQSFYKKSTDWGLYVRTEFKKVKEKSPKKIRKISKKNMCFPSIMFLLPCFTRLPAILSAQLPNFRKRLCFLVRIIRRMLFTGFRRRYPLLACYAPRRFFLPSALNSIFCRFSQGVTRQGWFSSCQALNFSHFSPYSFSFTNGKTVIDLQWGKKYVQYKRERKKKKPADTFGGFCRRSTSLVHRREWGVGVDLASFFFLNSSRTNLVRGPGHKAKLVLLRRSDLV
jgi:hypothetical protein